VVANRTDERRVEAIAALRRLRFTGAEIAELLGMALSTVSGILTRIGMGKLGRLGCEPAQRYERARPGELIHIDVKKLGRIQGGAGKRVRDGLRQHYNPTFIDRDGHRRQSVGWEFVHIAIDDATRLAYVEVLADEKALTAVGFLRRAVEHFNAYGVTVERLITDNGSPTDPPCTRSPAAPSGSATCAPSPTAPRPTARPVSQDHRAVRGGGEAPRACRSDSGKGMPEIEISSEPSWRREPFSWPAFDLSTGGLRAGRRR
jgi:hypothetical protein